MQAIWCNDLFAEERHSLLGGVYNSNSDLSTNLCEIEDSECETEHKPLNYMGGVQQTSVWHSPKSGYVKARHPG